MSGWINSLVHYLEAYGLIAVGLLIFLEDFGVPVPGETVLIATSVTASQGKINILLVALVAFVAAVAGDNIGWIIGHYGGRRLLYAVSCRLTIGGHYLLGPSKVREGERFFQKHGRWIIVIARFLDVLRQLNGIIAGSLDIPWRTFFVYNMIGAALWVGTWASVGYFAGSTAGSGAIGKVLLYVFIGIVVLGVATYLIRRLIRWLKHEQTTGPSREEEQRICLEERGGRSERGPKGPGQEKPEESG
jgi:membrane protein DedA with SNARE-associated domain